MNEHQDVWQKDIPTGAPFEVELREPSPKTVPMKKGGTFDKWKAGIPRSNPLHQGGENEVELVWFMLVSNHLKEALRVAGSGRVTIVATRSGDDETFEVSEGWTSSAGSAGGGGESRNLSYGNGRAGRALPGGVTAAQHLGALCRATAFAHGYLRDSSSVEAAMLALAGDESRSSFESTILIAAGKIAFSASMAALDSDQDFAEQMKQLVRGRAADSSSSPPSGSSAPRPPDEPYGPEPEEADDGELPF